MMLTHGTAQLGETKEVFIDFIFYYFHACIFQFVCLCEFLVAWFAFIFWSSPTQLKLKNQRWKHLEKAVSKFGGYFPG